MKTIALHGKYGKGKSVIVDDADYDDLASYRWVVNYYGYAVRSAHKDLGLGQVKLLHRQVMSPAQDQIIDHINGKQTRLGYYHTAEEASQAYTEASNKHYGEFSHASIL